MRFTKEDYVARIRNASPMQLLLITFELALTNIEDAKASDSGDAFEKHVRKSQDFLMQLMSSLDMKYEISGNLLNIYIYVNKLLNEAYFSKNKETLDDCIELLTGLMQGFEIISEDDSENAQAASGKVYAGLTYRNGRFDEMVIESMEKEFRA